MRKLFVFAGIILVFLFCSPSWAVSINFDDIGLTHGDEITNYYAGVTFNGIENNFPLSGPYPVPPTLPTVLGGAGIWNPPSTPGGNFAVGWAPGFDPGDVGILMTFDSLISEISLTGLDYGDNGGDFESITLAAYNDSGVLLGSQQFFGTPLAVMGTLTFSGMKYVSFNYTDTQYGFFGIDNVEYTPVSSSIPEPATMFLLGFGFIGLVGLKRKIKA